MCVDMTRTGSRARRLLSPLLTVLAALLIGAAGVLLYADRNVFSSDRFADHAADALAKPEVRDAVADRLTRQIVRVEPDLTGATPLVESATSAIIGTEAFRRIFAKAVADLHRTVFSRDRDTVALKVTDVGLLVVEGLEAVAPKVASKIPTDLQTRLLALSKGDESLAVGIARFGDEIDLLWIVLAVLGLLALLGSFLASDDRRRAVPHLALALTAVGVAGVVGFELARVLVGGLAGEASAGALREVWDSYFGGFRTLAIGLAGIGLITAAAGFELIRPLDARGALLDGWARLVRTPDTAAWRAARAVAMLAGGILIVVFPAAAVRAVVLIAGGLLLYGGAAELLRLIAPPPRIDSRPRRGRAPGRRRLVIGATTLASAAAIVAVALALAGEDRTPSASSEIDGCNGSPELCDRTVDEVVFPGTHNSFSAADRPNWLFAQQEKGLSAQLDAGLRALLIDTHYGIATDRGTYTVLQAGSTSREKIEEPLGERFVDTAMRLRDRIDPGTEVNPDDAELFFCHAFCELGSQPTIEGMKEIRDFLVRNPNEVLILSVESDVSLESNADAFKRSGLLDLVWKGAFRDGEFPTLREMIEADQRAVVLMWQRGPLGEAGFGDYPWMHRQFGVVQETSYEYNTPQGLLSADSCGPNEGRDTNPLFLLNHWVETSPYFLPSNARKVNAYDAFLERAQTCERERGLLPNILAVDFFEEGDLVDVARTLNGLPRGG